MVGGKGQRATRRKGQRTAVDGNDIGGTGVAEIRIGGELQLSGGDRDRAAERVRGGKGDDAGSRLSDAGGASENSRDRAGTQQEVGGRRKAARGAGDGARIQGHDTDRLGEGGEIKGAAREGHSAGVSEHFIATQSEGATVDIGTARIGIVRAERELTVADLGESSRGIRSRESGESHRSAGAAPADEVDLRNGAGHVGSGIGDDDAGNRGEHGVDDRVALSGRAAGNHAGGAEADQGGADVTGASGQGHVRLGDADTRGRTQRRVDGDVEARGVDGQSAVEVRRANLVVDGTIEHGVDRGTLDGRRQETREVIAGLERAAGAGEIDGGIPGSREVRRKVCTGTERALGDVDEDLGTRIFPGRDRVSDAKRLVARLDRASGNI